MNILDLRTEDRDKDVQTEVATVWKQMETFSIPVRILLFDGMAPIGEGVVRPYKWGSSRTPNPNAGKPEYSVGVNGFDDFFSAILHAHAEATGMDVNEIWRFVEFVNRMLIPRKGSVK